VIIKSFRFKKAIPALLVGVAFFMSGCQAGLPKKTAHEPAPLDPLADANSYLRSGDLEMALIAYNSFIEAHPEAQGVEVAMHRVADIYSNRGDLQKAVQTYGEIERLFPQYEGIIEVRYSKAKALFDLKDYRSTIDEARKWLSTYTGNPLEINLLLYMGDSYMALGQRPSALVWWLEAKRGLRNDEDLRNQVGERIELLIRKADLRDLQTFYAQAGSGEYEQVILHRIAGMLLDRGELDSAKKTAMALVRSTPQQFWVDLGRQLLQKIAESESFRKGVVGCLVPLSGPFSIYGEELLNGIQIAVLDGGSDRIDLEILIKDTKGDPGTAVSALEELVYKEKVVAVIGPLSSRSAEAVAKRGSLMGVPIITLTQKEDVAREGEMIFRNFLTPLHEVSRLLERSSDELDLDRFAILYPENSYGRFFMNLFWDELEKKGKKVTAAESYEPGLTDFAEQIKKLSGAYYPRPASVIERFKDEWSPQQEEAEIYPQGSDKIIDFDAIFMPDNYQTIAMIVPQLVYHDITEPLVMGTSLWHSRELMELAGEYAQGAIFPSGFFEGSKDPLVEDFVHKYEENFESYPGILAATGYDTLRFLAHALSKDDILNSHDLKEALLATQGFRGVTGSISFDCMGEAKKRPLLLTISGKKMKILD